MPVILHSKVLERNLKKNKKKENDVSNHCLKLSIELQDLKAWSIISGVISCVTSSG